MLFEDVLQLLGLCRAVLDNEDFHMLSGCIGFHGLVTTVVKVLAMASGGNTCSAAPTWIA